MHTFADLAKALNRSTVYLSGLQSRFEIPTFDSAGCYGVGKAVVIITQVSCHPISTPSSPKPRATLVSP